MPYQFRQTGAEIQDILDQVGENTGDIAQNAEDISTLNSNLTNSKFENVKIVSVSTNKTTVTINGFPGSGYAYGNILLFSASSIYYIWFGAATPQINRVYGTATAPTGTWNSTTLTYTITFSGTTQITVFAMGGIGRFGTITIS